MLTKRKEFPHKSGSNTVRGKYKQQKAKSNFVSLNSKLRSQGNFEPEQRKSTERSKAGKLSADASSKLQLKNQFDNQNIIHDALLNVELIKNKIGEKKNVASWNTRNPLDLIENMRSLEDPKDNNQILPTSSNRRQYTQSRQSSRNSRNRSTSNSQKQKLVICKSSAGGKLKNIKKYE